MRSHSVRPSIARRLSAAALTAGLLFVAGLSRADSTPPPSDPSIPLEYRVKAAYLYNFIRFTEWPEAKRTGPHPPIVIGVIGYDGLGNRLDDLLAGTVVNNRPIRIRRIHSTKRTKGIDALYIARSEEDKIPHILRAVESSPILTISEARLFIERGGMIRLEPAGGRVTFSVSAAKLRDAGLTPSSQMLQYGRVVER